MSDWPEVEARLRALATNPHFICRMNGKEAAGFAADLLAALARIEALDGERAWRPIESAPMDGTRLLLGGCINGPSVRVGCWGMGQYNRSTREYERDWSDGPITIDRPTHWQPLPSPPKEAAR